jgi:hypothetical protein
VVIADDGATYCSCDDYVTKGLSNEMGAYQCVHIKRAVARAGVPMTAIDVAAIPEPTMAQAAEALESLRADLEPVEGPREAPAAPSVESTRITRSVAREIYALKGEATSEEVGQIYGVNPSSVRDLWVGRTYRWATGAPDNRRLKQQAAEPEPEAPEPEVVAPEPTPEPEEEIVVMASPTVEATPVAQAPEAPETALVVDLIGQMADYLEVLAEFAGRPLPRLFKLDLDEVNRVVSRAREITGG